MYRPGDRVRFETTGDDGWPLIRYGFVGGVAGNGGPVVVMLDGELSGDVVNRAELQPVTITSVELCLRGADLIDDPELRRGLVALWHAEADSAGLDVDELHPIGDGQPRIGRLLGARRAADSRSAIRRPGDSAAQRARDHPGPCREPQRRLAADASV